jgi:HlyD family secretion protein
MFRALILLLLVAGIGFGANALIKHGIPKQPEKPAYLTMPVERGDLETTITSVGTVKAVVEVEVGSQLSGQIAELLADFNDEVRQGEPIALLDSRSFEARVRGAKATLEEAQARIEIQEAAIAEAAADLNSKRAALTVVEEQLIGSRSRTERARRDLKRRQALLKKGATSQSEVDRVKSEYDSEAADLRAALAQKEVGQAEIHKAEAAHRSAQAELKNARAEVKKAEAALEQAEIELSRTTIRSPVDGVVIGRDVDEGQTVAASLEAPVLFKIAQDLRFMEVHTKVDEADIGSVQVGQTAHFKVDAFPGRRVLGEVLEIRKAPNVIENVVAYTVVVSAENPELLLLPGMTATVQIFVQKVNDVLKVSNAALRFRPAGVGDPVTGSASAEADGKSQAGRPATVWVLDGEGAPAPVRIRVGASDRRDSEVLAGALQAGDPLIIGTAAAEKESTFLGLRLRL